MSMWAACAEWNADEPKHYDHSWLLAVGALFATTQLWYNKTSPFAISGTEELVGNLLSLVKHNMWRCNIWGLVLHILCLALWFVPPWIYFQERFTAADRRNPTSLHKKPQPINLAFKPLLSLSCNHQNLRADCPLANTSHSMTFNIVEMINVFLLHLWVVILCWLVGVRAQNTFTYVHCCFMSFPSLTPASLCWHVDVCVFC